MRAPMTESFPKETMERYISAVASANERARTLQDRESEAREENALASQNVVRQRNQLEKLERTGYPL